MDDELRKGVEYGFIDNSIVALDHYSPKLVTNNFSRGEKVLSAIQSELNKLDESDEFMFSVAFITEDGIAGLLMDLENLQKKGVKGRIVASQYQNFTRPKALRKLLSFDNIEVRIVTEEYKMHTKCYIFRKGNSYNIIIGSSNLTAGALSLNEEWNLKFSSTDDGSITQEAIDEFNSIFNKAVPVNEPWLKQYSEIYDRYHEFRTELERKRFPLLDGIIHGDRINPNMMQVSALEAIDQIRSENLDRALLISATGTGKTYLSAFDVRKFNPKRLLYLVHREVILKKAMESFERVVGGDKKMGLLTGNSKEYNVDYLFSTIQTMSQYHVMNKFPRDHFDYIVIDEAHHLGAETYQKIIDHFSSRFILGMTATPERTDGFDIFRQFNYNVAFEIRLKQAMEQNMVCPFHYYGISDLMVNGESLKEKEDFSRLVSDERVRHIINKIRFYGYCGDRVRGLIFCRSPSEAKELSERFNEKGYKTTYLTGKSSLEEREEAIEKLESKDREKSLDYIFVIDIFNEGVDIPAVNQIVMLRPTESPIVFTQQLGRGLRHSDGKDYVVVIDFIGNYDNNYLIPIALSGDTSFKKDNVRRFVVDANGLLPGTSTISFDKIIKERIFAAIDNKNFSKMKIILDAYKLLKQKLGRIPKLTDYEKFGSVDAMKFIEITRSYHNFLTKYEEEYEIKLSEKESKTIENLSRIVCSGKREHELCFFESILDQEASLISSFKRKMKLRDVEITEQAEKNLIAVFTGEFFRGKYDIIVKKGTEYATSDHLIKMLKSQNVRWLLQDIYDLGKENHEKYYLKKYNEGNFVLNQQYSYEDICRLLNWDKSENALNIGGYKYDQTTNTFPVFINYVKGEDVVESQKYEDHFVNPGKLIAAPKSTENKKSAKNLRRIENSEANRTKILLFVRKNKDGDKKKEFYYLGDMKFDRFIESESSLMIEYSLLTPVISEIYEYLIADIYTEKKNGAEEEI